MLVSRLELIGFSRWRMRQGKRLSRPAFLGNARKNSETRLGRISLTKRVMNRFKNFFFFYSSSYTVWCRGKYKVRVRALDIVARMSQFSSDAQMYFISSAQRRLGRARIDYEPKTTGVEIWCGYLKKYKCTYCERHFTTLWNSEDQRTCSRAIRNVYKFNHFKLQANIFSKLEYELVIVAEEDRYFPCFAAWDIDSILIEISG